MEPIFHVDPLRLVSLPSSLHYYIYFLFYGRNLTSKGILYSITEQKVISMVMTVIEKLHPQSLFRNRTIRAVVILLILLLVVRVVFFCKYSK